MTLDAIVQVILDLGFPIACVIALGIFCWRMVDKLINQQKEREERLYEEIGECRVINQKAIETIAQYAEKLDVIKDNIDVVKTDLTVIKTKLDS